MTPPSVEFKLNMKANSIGELLGLSEEREYQIGEEVVHLITQLVVQQLASGNISKVVLDYNQFVKDLLNRKDVSQLELSFYFFTLGRVMETLGYIMCGTNIFDDFGIEFKRM